MSIKLNQKKSKNRGKKKGTKKERQSLQFVLKESITLRVKDHFTLRVDLRKASLM